ncbi:MAG: hypothetical protein OXK19_02580 [Candidatus Dadabacteria bacterium]|nr:hypothetical protein [Candidatus Dadabacteria bacterium]
MSNKERSDLTAADLPVTLYLNQRLTFDLLAVLQGGFSSFSTVQTTSLGETATNLDGKAQLGVSNAFAFLGVDLSAQGSRQTGQKKSESTTEKIVHTPASLFARLRKELRDRELVCSMTSPSNLEEVHPSDFVEFQAALRRSPLIDILDTFSQLIPLISMADAESRQATNRGGKGKNKQNEYSDLKKQMELFKSAVTAEGSQDFIAEMHSLRVVLTTEQDYFIDPSMNDIIDGTFRVFGKITRVVSDDTEGISLLRNTALGRFGGIVEQLGPVIESMKDSGFSGSLETYISGPTMQVIPIAIFS